MKRKIITGICRDLLKAYHDPELAHRMCDSLMSRSGQGAYSHSLNLDEFLYFLSEDLQNISGDRHLAISGLSKYAEEVTAYRREAESLSKKELRRRVEKGKREYVKFEQTLPESFEFGEISLLSDETGYLKIKSFENYDVKHGNRIKMSSVSKFFTPTKNLIIDLRDNQGGVLPSLINFLSSFVSESNTYLVTSESVSRYKSDGEFEERRSQKKFFSSNTLTPAPLSQKKIILLINYYTFSAAKEAAYALKKMKPETTIIGECTIMGGNSFNDLPSYREYYQAYIPSGKLVYERSDGLPVACIGICPDIVVPEDSIYQTALSIAGIKDADKNEKIKYLNKEKIRPTVKTENAEIYTGNFLKAKIENSAGYLILHYGHLNKDTLTQTSTETFYSNHFSKIEFQKNAGQKIISVTLTGSNGLNEVFFKRD